MENPDIIAAVEPVIKAFEKLGVFYYIGGSIASSAYGLARATLDVDMVSDLKPENVSILVEMIESEYYIDKEMILNAIKRGSSFNIIHLETMLKVDIFLKKDSPYAKEAFKRKRKETLDEENRTTEFFLASCEDIILNKLEWFLMGGEVSERQWNDVLGVIKVQGDLLDKEYLSHWGADLGVTGLLERAFKEVDEIN
jgi:hypothetical protein